MLERTLQKHIEARIKDHKVVLLIGPRQVGKTTLLHEIIRKESNYLWWNGDDADVRSLLKDSNSKVLNALIKQFNPLALRNDTGALWENFIISERMKSLHYKRIFCNRYFWRNKAQQEIDYIEEANSEIKAYEFKWSEPKRKQKFPPKFIDSYQPQKTEIIHSNNYLSFILPGWEE